MRFCYFIGPLARPLVSRNLITGNSASYGGGIACMEADPWIEQATIDGNGARAAGACLFARDNSRPTLHSTIATRGRGGGGLWSDPGSSITTFFCDVWGNLGGNYIGCDPGPGDLSGDPRFCNQSGAGFRLSQISCCQGAGEEGDDIGAYPVGCFTIPEVVFYDNFSDQDDQGWSVTTSGDAALSPQAGTLRGEAMDSGSHARAVVESETPIPEDFQLEVKVLPEAGSRPEPMSGEAPGWIDLFLRYQDPDRCYLVRANGRIGRLMKWTQAGGTMVAEFDCPWPDSQWVTFRVSAVGPALEGFLTAFETTRRLFAWVDDLDPIPSGTVGVGLASEGDPLRARFDDILVSRSRQSGGVVNGRAVKRDSEGRPLRLDLRRDAGLGSASLSFELGEEARVRLGVYNLGGALIASLIDHPLPAGVHLVFWNGHDTSGRAVPGGIYFARLETPASSAARKIAIVR